MSDISRRRLITRGLAAAAGLSGLALAERIADRYGLIPPDHGGVLGAGETLTYAAAVRERNVAADRRVQASAGRRIQRVDAVDWRSCHAAGDALDRRPETAS